MVSSSSREGLPPLDSPSILRMPLSCRSVNSSVGAWPPPGAGMYCPVLLSLASAWPVTSTLCLSPAAVMPRPGGADTVGSLARMDTAVPGCQVLIAGFVRYSLAAW